MVRELDLLEQFRDMSLACHSCREGESSFRVRLDGVLRFQDKVCVPSVSKFRRVVLEEGHKSSLSIHLGATKMYQFLRQMF